ncbi:YihY/virulence factor BrkB family protein [Hymenobacter lutimineralis]|uniref:YihY/virulence factor BrkB family protein n=1 Tax=Hymenobacter lutimineralis TaxID=2606448 RepID=A0A5D6VE46_9BACT|nr:MULTISPECIES: YihY/virulence factor BrkB family protein [Hymenobacter]QIX61255.1 YihY/virulence factor BrkB family protein [Hymenobacter sp. BT18]TYZ13472.1 YihY/virulence factor BrkB family protein [Hymenobacter lutimineralis]
MATHYRVSDIFNILKTTASEFMVNNSFRHAAALSYYTIFSLPPLLLIVITIASSIYGAEAVTGQVYGQLRGFLGADSAKFLQDSIAEFTKQQKGGLATVIGIGTLIFAATTFFVTLQESINDIWNLKVKPRNGIWQFVRDRLLSFGLILSVALLLLISFVVSAILSAFTGKLQQWFPEIGVVVIKLVDFFLSLGVTSLLFALIYRFLPDAVIRWRDVGIGAVITATLFVLGKFLIAFYIAKANPGSAFGAAGSAIVLLLWVNYSALIIFFGAEFTQEFADAFGQKVQPKAHAVRIETREVPEGETKEEITTGRPRSTGRWKS